MLGKTSRPVIGKLTSEWGSGDKPVFTDAPATSPRSPLDLKIQSPRGLKNYYDLGGVGLGIVAALEKSGYSGSEIRGNKAVFVRNMSLNSNPIPVKFPPNRRGSSEDQMDLDDDHFEDYTFVTCHGPNKSYNTSVMYCDNGGELGRRKSSDFVAVFHISPARFEEDMRVACPPVSDFLSSCHLCQKKLHGKDIYMYRGEKAFCSTECRFRQISMDEASEQK